MEFNTKVICANHDLGKSDPLTEYPNQWTKVESAEVYYVEGGLRARLKAFSQSNNADFIYLNSLFSPHYSLLPLALKKLGFWRSGTLLIAPRGELSPGALALKAPKKKLFLRMFNLLRLQRHVLWHASSQLEADHITKQFGEVTVLVRENETSLPTRAHSRQTRKSGPPRLLFVSRLDEKKGLHTLLEALQGITDPFELNIVGAFEDTEYKSHCLGLVKKLSDESIVTFSGALERSDVLQAMQSADFMVFPTAGENFGHVIAEALSQSCPVICSVHTPWTSSLNNGGGATVHPNSPEAWREAIEKFISTSGPEFQNAATSAGQAYNQWRNEDKGRHIFELAVASIH